MRLIHRSLPADHYCPCGALLERGMRRCRKCRARSRWRRRKAYKPRPVSARRPSTRPARRGR